MHDVTKLTEALKRLFDMKEPDAIEVSRTVLDAFEGRDEIPDERLDQDLRSVFYTLEAKKLLAFRREDYSNETGERRRAFYWRFRTDVIQRALGMVPAARERDVYTALPPHVWARRAS